MQHRNRPQVVFVTGKGGVGKTTSAILIAMAAAKQGLKTVIAEVNGATCVPRFFEKKNGSYAPTQLATNLYTLSINPTDAIKEYAIQQLKFKRLYRLIFENRYVKPLINAAPGLKDAVQIGKIYFMAENEQWDLIIVDAPATGHGLSMLEATQTMMELSQVGPMYENSVQVEAVMGDPKRSQILLVSLPEDLPTKESIDLWQRMTSKRQEQCKLCIVNKWLSPPTTHEPWHLLSKDLPESLQSWRQWTDLLHQKSQKQNHYVLSLQQHLPLPLLYLPRLSARPDSSWVQHGDRLLQQLWSSQ